MNARRSTTALTNRREATPRAVKVAWLDQAIALHGEGKNSKEIGAVVGVSGPAVCAALAARGIRFTRKPAVPPVPKPDGRCRTWVADAIILHGQGLNGKQIASRVGRSDTSVYLALTALGYYFPRKVRAKPAAKPAVPLIAAIRPPEPERRIGAPLVPVLPLTTRRPIVIPEAETVHAAPGLWVTK